MKDKKREQEEIFEHSAILTPVKIEGKERRIGWEESQTIAFFKKVKPG